MKSNLDQLYNKALKVDKLSSIEQRKQAIDHLKNLNTQKLYETQRQIRQIGERKKINSNSNKLKNQTAHTRIKMVQTKYTQNTFDKNQGVGDMDKMIFEKKFKNYLNHKEQFIEKAKRRRQQIMEIRKKNITLEPGQDYYNQEEILSNNGSDYQYMDSQDMLAAYQQIATGKRHKKGGVQLFHGQKIQFQFRIQEFQMLLQIMEEGDLISKDLLLNYLFEEPSVMMLYSINPYLLADELSDLLTQVPEMLCFEQFSKFLLNDREPTYFQYTQQNLDEAKKIGRGLKCAPIIGKWLDEVIYENIIEIFHSLDIFGDEKVDRTVLAKKIKLWAQQSRLMDVDVIEIVNINKMVPLNRLIYEIQYEQKQNESWTLSELENYLNHYHRLKTPVKDQLITKLIMSGKYDPTYIYIVSQEALSLVKEIFTNTQKFAEYFVLKESYIDKFIKHSKYARIKSTLVRSQSNQYVNKENIQQTLNRIMKEGDQYLDIQQILDFFTNRGRPKVIEYHIYLANLQKQLQAIQQQERIKSENDTFQTSSDEQYSKQITKKRIARKKQRLLQIRKSQKVPNKKVNVTIPVPYAFDGRDKVKKTTIREMKVKQMLQEKQQKQLKSMVKIKPRQVPRHVKQNLYERFVKDQQRERLERLEKFKLEIQQSMIPISQRLITKKQSTPHCTFVGQPFKFVARPMPWYCQVNLLKRIIDQKQQRRERILELIINRHSQFDVPEGVQRMLNRQQQLQEKRRANRTISTHTGGQCTFHPKITHDVPDFKNLHEMLNINLETVKQYKPPITLEPFSFENRPKRSRTAHHHPQKKRVIQKSKSPTCRQEQLNIPSTLKHLGLMQLRKKQEDQRQKKQEQQFKASQIRKLRQQKFAPFVRKVLRKRDHELGKSRQQIQQAMRQYRKNQRKKKRQNEQQMLKIYTKVFNRPLLVENAGNDHEPQSIQYENHNIQQKRSSPKRQKQQPELINPKEHYHERLLEHNHMLDKGYEEKRRKAIDNYHPGQYFEEQQGERYGEEDFEEQFMSEHGNYTN